MKWLFNWDKELCISKKSILLLLDNCSALPVVEGLTNICLEFFFPQTPPVFFSPLMLWLFCFVKAHYCTGLVRKFSIFWKISLQVPLPLTCLPRFLSLKLSWCFTLLGEILLPLSSATSGINVGWLWTRIALLNMKNRKMLMVLRFAFFFSQNMMWTPPSFLPALSQMRTSSRRSGRRLAQPTKRRRKMSRRSLSHHPLKKEARAAMETLQDAPLYHGFSCYVLLNLRVLLSLHSTTIWPRPPLIISFLNINKWSHMPCFSILEAFTRQMYWSDRCNDQNCQNQYDHYMRVAL